MNGALALRHIVLMLRAKKSAVFCANLSFQHEMVSVFDGVSGFKYAGCDIRRGDYVEKAKK